MGSAMSPQTTLNRAAAVLRRVSPVLPADAALRAELAAHRQYSPAERRATPSVTRQPATLPTPDTLKTCLIDA